MALRPSVDEPKSHLKNRILGQGRGGAEFPREAGLPTRSIFFCGS